ncbi:right-handed parallel beta-helix repeat-containing protein [Streptomyces sp. CA-250714]|uniref:right-handed parallel beta-helix repeat-containing protein n=1 Tax=Streptomyces sp. CA-250714 TaxID=3240060 RepID=UPI003D93EEB7
MAAVLGLSPLSGAPSPVAVADEPEAPAARLSTTVSAQGRVVAGGSAVLVARTSNAPGARPAPNPVTVRHTLPKELTPTQASGRGWRCSVARQQVSCTYPGSRALAPSETFPPVQIRVKVAASAKGTVRISSEGTAHPRSQSRIDITAGRPARTYYLDCRAGNDKAAGTTTAGAWRTPARASAHTYGPGERLLIKRGTRCTGALKPKGKGAPGRPVLIDAYGRGPKPHLEGAGARGTVHLVNTEQWEVRNLDISNTAARPSKTQRRAGLLAQLSDYGVARHFVVEGVDVHDVTGGAFAKDPDPSGGILFVVRGSKKPTRFAGIRVANSTLRHVDRTGIGTTSTWARRPENPEGAGRSWEAITGLTIRRNKLYDIGGDGIVVQNAKGALVERNYLNGFNRRGNTYNAGIWAWNADEVLYQYNEVTGGRGTKDSMAFDFDGGNNRSVYRYNYSHDNEGGFLLICPPGDTITSGNRFHDNVSINDRNTRAGYGVISVLCGPSRNNRVYRNTVVTSHANTRMVSNDSKDIQDGGVATFENNIFVGAPEGTPLKDTLSTFNNNLYWRIGLPTDFDDPKAVKADPMLRSAGPKTPDDLRLRPGSPALGTGTKIDGDRTERDFFNNPILDPPNIGADQGRPAARRSRAG